MSGGNIAARQGSSMWTRNASNFALIIRVAFGVVWLVDGVMKFVWLVPSDVVSIVQTAGQGQPSWLAPWFSFWGSMISSNAAFVLYGVGLWEVILGITLMFGLMRKVSYLSGILLSLLIWSIDEGFGGPYGPGSTDIGAAVMYVFVFLALIVLESTAVSNRFSFDAVIERRSSAWKRISEFSG